MGVSCDMQVSKEEGKLVDSECHKLTASFQRRRHRQDNRTPLCSYYEVRPLAATSSSSSCSLKGVTVCDVVLGILCGGVVAKS